MRRKATTDTAARRQDLVQFEKALKKTLDACLVGMRRRLSDEDALYKEFVGPLNEVFWRGERHGTPSPNIDFTKAEDRIAADLLAEVGDAIEWIDGESFGMASEPEKAIKHLEKASKLSAKLIQSFATTHHQGEVLELRDDAVKLLDGLVRSTARGLPAPLTTGKALAVIEPRCLHKKEQSMLSKLLAGIQRSGYISPQGDSAWDRATEELLMLRDEIKHAPTAPKGARLASLHSKLVRLAHAHPEFRDHLMPLILAPKVTFGKAAANQSPTPWRTDGVVEDLHAELYKLVDEHRLANGRAPDGTGALEYQIRFLRASLKKSLPWIYDNIAIAAENAMAQSPELSPVAKKVIKEAQARRKEWDTDHAAVLAERTHA
jgi:hypothetical protein